MWLRHPLSSEQEVVMLDCWFNWMLRALVNLSVHLKVMVIEFMKREGRNLTPAPLLPTLHRYTA